MLKGRTVTILRQKFAALVFCLPIALALPPAAQGQTTMNAGVIMEKMPPNERLPFVAGIVEGLAYARYLRDDKQVKGINCIYAWFYDKKDRIQDIYQAFNRFKEHMPGAIVATMVAKECGN